MGLRAEGVAILYVSHRLDEILKLTDRVAVLRDGRMVGSLSGSDITPQNMISLMIGRSLQMLYVPPHRPGGELPAIRRPGYAPGMAEGVQELASGCVPYTRRALCP